MICSLSVPVMGGRVLLVFAGNGDWVDGGMVCWDGPGAGWVEGGMVCWEGGGTGAGVVVLFLLPGNGFLGFAGVWPFNTNANKRTTDVNLTFILLI